MRKFLITATTLAVIAGAPAIANAQANTAAGASRRLSWWNHRRRRRRVDGNTGVLR